MNLELRELVRAGADATSRSTSRTTPGFPEDLPLGRSARSTRWSRASRRAVACTSATATATASRRGRAATATCSPPSSRRAWTSSRSSSRGAARRTCALFKEFDPPFALGLGVIDVKTHDVETPAIVAERIREALEIVPGRRLAVNPDCGLPAPAARRRLRQALRHGGGHAARPAGARRGVSPNRRSREPAGRRARPGGSATSSSWSPRRSGARRSSSRSPRAWRGVPDVVAGSITSYAGGAMGHDPLRVGTAARARGLTPNIHLTCVSQDRRGLAQDPRGPARARHRERLRAHRRLPATRGRAARRRAPSSISTPSSSSGSIDELRRGGPRLSHRRRRLAVQVRRGGLRLPVPEAREEDRRRRRLRDHAGRMGRAEVRRAQALPRRARARGPRCSATSTCSARAPPSGWRGASRRAAGYRRRCSRPCAQEAAARTAAPRPARARRAHGRRAAGPRLRRRVHRRHARRRARRVDHPARAASWRRAGRSWPTELHYGPRWLLPLRPAGGPGAIPVGGAPAAGPRCPSRDRSASPSRRTRGAWRRGSPASTASDGCSRSRGTRALRRVLARLAAWADRRPAVARAVERVELAVKKPLFGCQACGNCVLGPPRVRLPADVSQAAAQRPVRRHATSGRCEVVDQPCVWVGV